MNYIFFNAEMVKQIKTGRKTEARRPVVAFKRCCYGKPGNVLLVLRRTPFSAFLRDKFPKMFRKFFWIWYETKIEIVSLKQKKLKQYIDFEKEGFETLALFSMEEKKEMFYEYWDKIYGDTYYQSRFNPTVWVIEFKVVGK